MVSLNYQLRDNLVDARAALALHIVRFHLLIKFDISITLYLIPSPAIARSAALVLNIDIAFILLVCRKLYLFSTTDAFKFKRYHPFIVIKVSLSTKLFAWAIVGFTVAHILDFYRFAMARLRFLASISPQVPVLQIVS